LRGRLRPPASASGGCQLRDDPVVPLNELRGVEAVVGLAEQLHRAEPVFRPGGPAKGHLQILRFEVGTELRAEFRGACQSSFDEDRELVTADARQLVRGVG